MIALQKRYITEWHNNFVIYIVQLSSILDRIKLLSGITDADKRAIDEFKILLHRKDIREVETDLAQGTIKESTLGKIEKLEKDIVDFAIDHMHKSPLYKEILKHIYYHLVDWNKKVANLRLNELQISIEK